MMERNRLGYRIRSQREARGLTKSEFSRQVGVTPTAVHNWEENGVIPRTEMLAEIARVLRVDTSVLTGRAASEGFDVDTPDASDDIEIDHAELVMQAKSRIAAAFGVLHSQVDIQIRL